MSRLVDFWKIASSDIGFDVVEGFILELAGGKKIESKLLVKGYGAVNGMIIVSDYDKVAEDEDEIISLGYGFSVLDEPKFSEQYERVDFIDMLNDWGKSE